MERLYDTRRTAYEQAHLRLAATNTSVEALAEQLLAQIEV
jgi:hypothetical protein